MIFKKSISMLAIASQLIWICGAYAGSTAPEAPSPEQVLLENVIALDGSNLSLQQIHGKIQAEATEYARTAPAAGQIDRFQSATVTLGMFTPEQAASVFADARRMTANLAPTTENVVAVTEALLTLHPSGAQFSSNVCDGLLLGALGSLAIAVVTILVASGGNTDFSSSDHPVAADIVYGAMAATGVTAVAGALGCL